jgi:hypothetical protein
MSITLEERENIIYLICIGEEKIGTKNHFITKYQEIIMIMIILNFLVENNVTIYFEAAFLKIVQEKNIVAKSFPSYSNYEDLTTDFDALISIGGDGTILKAATFLGLILTLKIVSSLIFDADLLLSIISKHKLF